MDEKRLVEIEEYLASQGHRSDPAPNIGLELATALRKAWADGMTVGLRHQDEEDRLTSERNALAMKLEAARVVLRECEEVLELTDPSGQRLCIHAFEDAEVYQLCERVGYGAVMDSAARQWRQKPTRNGGESGAFVTGPCIGTVQSTLKRIAAVLNG